MLYPETLVDKGGNAVLGPDGKPPVITPFDGFTDVGDFKLGLMAQLAPEAVQALMPLLGDVFTGGQISLAPEGVLLEVKALKDPPVPLKPDVKEFKLRSGSVYFDGKRKLLIVQNAVRLPGEWHFVGTAQLSKALLEALAAKKTGSITKIQRLGL